MALFGKLFEKKNCGICGKELGMFGKTKLADGYLCRDCDDKLSPFFTGRRSSSIEDIRTQLAYRERNAAELASFAPTTTIDGGGKKIYLDETGGRLVLSGSSSWRNENPDLITLDQVTGCETEVRESKTEIKRKDAEGNEVSYNPPRYDIDYDIYVKVFFNHPYFSEVSWKTNRNRIEKRPSTEYREAEERAEAVRQALLGIHSSVRASAAPKTAVTCPNCLAVTIPDASGCCEYCGSSLADVRRASQDDLEQGHGGGHRHDNDKDFARSHGRSGGSERDYGGGDDEDYGEGREHMARQQQRTTPTQPRVTGKAKADFRRMNQ